MDAGQLEFTYIAGGIAKWSGRSGESWQSLTSDQTPCSPAVPIVAVYLEQCLKSDIMTFGAGSFFAGERGGLSCAL